MAVLLAFVAFKLVLVVGSQINRALMSFTMCRPLQYLH